MSWWQRNVVEPGKLPLLLFAVAFIVTFLVTRGIARLIRSGRGPFKNNVTASGLHIHHSVPGIVLLIVGAVISFGASPVAPWREIAAVMAGAGASLILDEFAMILHLQDDYWTQEGRTSVEAVALTAMCLLLMLVGLSPLGVDNVDRAEAGARWAGLVVGLGGLVSIVVCAMKGKYRLVLLAIFVPVVAIVGAVRLARAGSSWAKKRYSPERQAKAAARTAAFDRRWDPAFRRLGNLIAGSPSTP